MPIHFQGALSMIPMEYTDRVGVFEYSQKGFECGNESSAKKKAQGGVQQKRLKGECRIRLKGECRKGIRLNPSGQSGQSKGAEGHRGC
jgi:hypothetical protein